VRQKRHEKRTLPIMRPERLRVWLAFITISTVWGTTWFAIRIGLETVPPFLSAGIRCCLAAVVLFALLRIRGGVVPTSHIAWKVYAALGILTIGMPFALIYWGQQYIATGLSSILFGVYPIWVALLSHFFLKNEPLNKYKVASIVLGFVGVVVIFSSDIFLADTMGVFGMLAVLVSTFLQAIALIIIKKHGEPVSPVAMNFVGMAMGGAMLLVLSLFCESGLPVVWTWPGIASLAYLTLVGSVVTFMAYYWLLKRMDAVYLSLSSFINPLIAVLIGSVALGERLSSTAVAGAVCVLIGMLTANGKAIYEKITSRA
jgi:drug/metabolite transporter (DMT)-like permease